MERLFTTQEVLESWNKSCKINDEVDKQAKDIVREALELKIAEEQGLLLKPKCKFGQDIYMKSPYWGIIPYKVNSIRFCNLGGFAYEVIATDGTDLLDDQEIDDSDFGVSAFFTKEEAEQKLEEMKGE